MVFSAKGISAAYISGEQEDKNVKKGVVNSAYQIVFFTPEMLVLNKQWRNLLASSTYLQRLGRLALDEAHTINKWYACTHVMIIYHLLNKIYCPYML